MRMPSFEETSLACRRHSYRFAAPDGVYVYWRSAGMDDVSQVRHLSVGGLFLATDKARPEGVKVKIEFLVEEGQIRGEAIVRRAEGTGGLGLKFTAISGQDRPRLAALLGRVRSHANLGGTRELRARAGSSRKGLA